MNNACLWHTWWRHQMEIFCALLALCEGNSPVTGEFPAQKPVTRSFGVFFDLGLNKRLSKQLWGWWFETPSCSSWLHCNDCWLATWITRNICEPLVHTSVRMYWSPFGPFLCIMVQERSRLAPLGAFVWFLLVPLLIYRMTSYKYFAFWRT